MNTNFNFTNKQFKKGKVFGKKNQGQFYGAIKHGLFKCKY